MRLFFNYLYCYEKKVGKMNYLKEKNFLIEKNKDNYSLELFERVSSSKILDLINVSKSKPKFIKDHFDKKKSEKKPTLKTTLNRL
jgi:hypothetical protein